MLQIRKTTHDAGGTLVGAGPLPLTFKTRTEAATFMHLYLAAVFDGGRSGYNEDHQCWWGCDDTGELQLHRYVVEPRAAAQDRSSQPV